MKKEPAIRRHVNSYFLFPIPRTMSQKHNFRIKFHSKLGYITFSERSPNFFGQKGPEKVHLEKSKYEITRHPTGSLVPEVTRLPGSARGLSGGRNCI